MERSILGNLSPHNVNIRGATTPHRDESPKNGTPPRKSPMTSFSVDRSWSGALEASLRENGNGDEQSRACLEALRAPLQKMVELEANRLEEARHVVKILEQGSLESKENSDRICRALDLHRQAEEQRRDAEAARLEATDAKRMKEGLMRRIAQQSDQLVNADEQNSRLVEQLTALRQDAEATAETHKSELHRAREQSDKLVHAEARNAELTESLLALQRDVAAAAETRESELHRTALQSSELVRAEGENAELREQLATLRQEAAAAAEKQESELHRTARQSSELARAEGEIAELREQLATLRQQAAAAADTRESELQRSAPNAEDDLVKCFRRLEARQMKVANDAIGATVDGIVASMVESVARSVETPRNPSGLAEKYGYVRAELEALTEFLEVESQTISDTSRALERETTTLRGKLGRAEAATRRLEQESKLESRKAQKRAEAMLGVVDEEKDKNARLLKDVRALRERVEILEKEKAAAIETLGELRAKHGSELETARREMRARKDELESERRRAEQFAQELAGTEAEIRRFKETTRELGLRLDNAQKGPPHETPRGEPSEVEEAKKRIRAMEAEVRKVEFENKMLHSENQTLKMSADVAGSAAGTKEIEKLRDEAEQYKSFAKRYKEKMDLRLREIERRMDAASGEVRKNWSVISRVPELMNLARLVVGREESTNDNGKSRRMSVV